MSAATNDISDPSTVHGTPQFGGFVEQGFTSYQGWHLMRDAAGLFLVATEQPGLLPGGFLDRRLLLPALGNNTDLVNVRTGKRLVQMLAGDTFTAADGPRPIYAVNNQEFGRSSTNATTGAARSIAGIFLCLDDEFPLTRCVAIIGPEGAAMAASILAPNTVPVYNAVITTIAAYAGTLTGTLTASATGAIGAQDTGVTLAAGMRVILPVITGGAGGATAAADSGPYLVVNPGGTGVKFVLTRPPEWYQGNVITPGASFKVDDVGTIWGGSEWRAFPATDALIIGTGDPAFWPRLWSAVATEASAITNAWIKVAGRVQATGLTGAHALYLSTCTAGAGNGAVTVGGTGADTYNVLSSNW